MRNRFADTFYELGKEDPRLCMVVADISPAGSIAKFRQEFPRRFINTGVAEQIMVGMAAGMCQRGLKPFAYTIATFALYRCFEFIRDDLAYQDLPVTVVGVGGGVAYSTLGATHHAQEDVSIACSVPNMTVLAPCDPYEVQQATEWCARRESGGPVYLRLGKAGEPTLDEQGVWRFGKMKWLRHGADACVLSYGPITKRAVEIGKRLNAAVVSVHTLKPLDLDGLAHIFNFYPRIIVIEECAPNGGLAMQVRAFAQETGATCKIDTFTLQDKFIHRYGSHDQLLDAHGLGVDDICARIGEA